MAYCNLINAGFSQKDAYIIAYRPTTNNETRIESSAKRKLTEHSVDRYLHEISQARARREERELALEKKIREQLEKEYKAKLNKSKNPDPDNSNSTIREKADIIKEINEQIDNATDAKEKREYLKMLIDVEQMKKETDIIEEDTILYYFPISCKECPHEPTNRLK